MKGLNVKKAITCICILLLSVAIGFSFSKIEELIIEKTHPIKYYEYVQKYSQEYGVPKEIILAVMSSESSFTSDAVSYKGAVGLMQIMPSTYEWLCTKTGDDPNQSYLYDPNVNIKYGTYFLSYLYSRFGVWETVYAAYNAGEGRVRGWLENPLYGEDGRLIEIPFEETKTYVKRVSERAKVYSELLKKEKLKSEKPEITLEVTGV